MSLRESFFTAVNAVIPFFCYLLMGALARRTGMVDQPFLDQLNQLIFKLMFSFMTFYNVYQADRDAPLSGSLLVFTGVSILLLQAVLLLTVPRLVRENPRRGVLIQAVYRSNFVLFGLPLTATLFGADSAALAAMLVTVVLTIYNITTVMILEWFRQGDKTSPGQIVVKLCHNPMLQGCCVGLLFFFLNIHLPVYLVSPVSSFSAMTTPLAMFALGGSLRFEAMRKNGKYIVPVLAAKLIAVPMILVTAAYTIGLRKMELFLVLAVFGTPVASGSYPMAVNMGGDGELAGQLVFASTAVSVLTLFGWIFFWKTLAYSDNNRRGELIPKYLKFSQNVFTIANEGGLFHETVAIDGVPRGSCTSVLLRRVPRKREHGRESGEYGADRGTSGKRTADSGHGYAGGQ